jgi:hypothetical protein
MMRMPFAGSLSFLGAKVAQPCRGKNGDLKREVCEVSSTRTVRPAARFPPKSNEGQASGELRSPWPTAFPFATLHFLLQTKGKLPRSQPANDEFAAARDEAAQDPE